MKRKLICLILAALLLLLPALAAAEAMKEANYETYTHSDGSYGFLYPDSWILLTRDNISELLADVEFDDEQVTALLESVKPQLEQADMVMLMAEDFSTNINIVKQALGMELNGELLKSLAPSLVAQLSASLPAADFSTDPEVIDVNGRDALMLFYTYELAGSTLAGIQVYLGVGTNLYVATLTCGAEQVSEYAETLGFLIGSMSFS